MRMGCQDQLMGFLLPRDRLKDFLCLFTGLYRSVRPLGLLFFQQIVELPQKAGRICRFLPRINEGANSSCKDSCVRAAGAGDVRLSSRHAEVSSRCIFPVAANGVLSRVNFSAVCHNLSSSFMTTDGILLFYGYPDGGCENFRRPAVPGFYSSREAVHDLLPVFFGQRCEKCRISCDTHNQIRRSFRSSCAFLTVFSLDTSSY